MQRQLHILLLSITVAISTLTTPTASANPPPAYEGLKLYVSYCQLCHGTQGKGDGTLAKAMKIHPADLTTTVRSRSDTILRKIIKGGEQTITGRDRHNLLSDAMPEWEKVFDDPQIESLIAYLRFLSRAKHELMGDPEAGYNLYQKYCQVCHGVEGDGDGIMTQLIGMMPTDHTNPNETNRFTNQQLAQSILDGKGRFMPAWKGILKQPEVEALVSYIRLLSQ
ncbi:MAG: c-type cytochrome [Gammaproteobacteria bacterium]|nr:c-type cytochrome [Gammaproteobacteria bacterium]